MMVLIVLHKELKQFDFEEKELVIMVSILVHDKHLQQFYLKEMVIMVVVCFMCLLFVLFFLCRLFAALIDVVI